MSINVDARHFYLDYVNNYLTVGRIAEDWDIPLEEAYRLIEQGRIN
jgi:hypothetical protein